MKKNLPDIDKLFKVALDGHEEDPSDKVWDALDRNLDKDKVIDFRKKYIHLKKIAIALLLLLIGAGVYTFVNYRKANEFSANTKNNDQNSNIIISQTTKAEENKNGTPLTADVDTTTKNELFRTPLPLPIERKDVPGDAVAKYTSRNAASAFTTLNTVNNKGEIATKNQYKKVNSTLPGFINLITLSTSSKINSKKELTANKLSIHANRRVFYTRGKQKASGNNGGIEEGNEPASLAMVNVKTPAIKSGTSKIYPELLTANMSAVSKKNMFGVILFCLRVCL